MDYMNAGRRPDGKVRMYLVVINPNTKYLYVHVAPKPPEDDDFENISPAEIMTAIEKKLEGTGRSLANTLWAIQSLNDKLKEITGEEHPIQYIRGDGDSAFGKIIDSPDPNDDQHQRSKNKEPDIELGHRTYKSNIFTKTLKEKGIELYLSTAKYINKNRSVDRVIRTIRDMVADRKEVLLDPDVMQNVVEIYNNTPHSAFDNKFTPLQVQKNADLEEYYIRENLSRLDEATMLQREAGFFNYKPGNMLLIHIPKAKTDKKFEKKRRAFSEVAMFAEYEHGNVNCYRMIRNGAYFEPSTLITLPTYYTKYVAASLEELPRRYRQLII
jgi:hypothetical protein